MKQTLVPLLTCFVIVCQLLLPASPSLLPCNPIYAQESNWPQWRGTLGTGAAPDADPPIEWSETTNLRWKIPLPGKGHSTPIVWGDRIFLTAAIPVGPQLPPKHSTAPGTHDGCQSPGVTSLLSLV